MNLKERSHSDQDGFTYLEVLVAIAIISISSFAVWNGIHGGLNAIEKIIIKSRITAELVLFEHLFRDAVNEIKTPYWENENTSFEFSIHKKNDVLIFDIHEVKHQFKYISLLEMNEQESGIEIRLETGKDSSVTLYARYGTFLLQGES